MLAGARFLKYSIINYSGSCFYEMHRPNLLKTKSESLINDCSFPPDAPWL